MLRYTLLGKRMRALSDDLDLAETAGINTARVILYTWLFAGALAGLAGVLAATNLSRCSPSSASRCCSPIFAAVVLGGIGDAFGALAGGMVLGLVTEWSTMFIDPRWKLGGRLRRPDPRPDRPPAGDLRQGEGGLGHARASTRIPRCRSRSTGTRSRAACSGSTSASSPGIYALLALGLQLNVGFTGITNFGQAGFMAIGGYTMAILTVDTGIVVLALAAALDARRDGLRAPRRPARRCACAPTTSRSRRSPAPRWSGSSPRTRTALTGGNQGFFCNDDSASASTTPGSTSRTRSRAGSRTSAGRDPGVARRRCCWS